MKQNLNFNNDNEWGTNTKSGFKYIEVCKDEKFIINAENNFYLVFFLTGEISVSCKDYENVHFHGGQMVLHSMKFGCEWTSLLDTSCIALVLDNDILPCDRKVIKEYAELWLDTVPSSQPLQIKPVLKHFLKSVKKYLNDDISCSLMHTMKRQELSLIFRRYYSQEEIYPFSLPLVCKTHEFKTFVMDNYLKMKGLKEFVDLSGMNLSQFNRKFKSHFKESPYQWLIKQRAKHVYQELSLTNKSFTAIAQEFHFSDASHFNRYCKSMYGGSPSEIRKASLAVATL